MTRRRALAVFVAAAALLVALNALVYSLYRSEVRTVTATLDDRLVALGGTAARWLSDDLGRRDASPLLSALVSENRLEDAYVIDGGLRVISGVRTTSGTSLNLLRVDQDRFEGALEGRSSVGTGYSIANVRVEVAYFPIGSSRVLAIEAGSEFHRPADRVRTTYVVAVALSVLVAVVFALGLGVALRALERARLAHGRTERLAAVGQMAAMVAHEVRNPLGILRGQVELARERLPADAPARERERFAEMVNEIDRLNRLTEEFLGLARDLPLDLVSVDLGDLIAAVADGARSLHGQATIEVRTPARPIAIRADADRLRQAILNLVLNALQVGDSGVGVTLEVAIDAARARITVADDGPGIPAALAADLFEPFVTARPGGTGLGLAVARRVAESHGGSLVLESTPGSRGARFSIYLPNERP
jgi:two-component system OmpR family sensor kinase